MIELDVLCQYSVVGTVKVVKRRWGYIVKGTCFNVRVRDNFRTLEFIRGDISDLTSEFTMGLLSGEKVRLIY